VKRLTSLARVVLPGLSRACFPTEDRSVVGWREKEFADKVRDQIPLVRELSKTPVMIVDEESEFKRAIKKGTD
jgi:hypothetical protein